MQLHEFLVENKDEILAITEDKTLELAGTLASSDQLKQGPPIFFQQLLDILLLKRPAVTKPAANEAGVAKAAKDSDEPAMARAAGKPEEEKVANSAGLHGLEMLRLGYTLSHVVHAYGAMCQAITELATKKEVPISTTSFHDLNQCLDIAIAGSVTTYQNLRNTQEKSREVEQLGALAHEMRNALSTATISVQLARSGTVGLSGSTGQVLDRSLKRMGELIDQSLTKVRLRMDPDVHAESGHLLLIVDQILVTAGVEARSRDQKIEVKIDPALVIEADQQAFHSALSNIIQNAIKFTRDGGKIHVRGKEEGKHVVIEIQDECGGLNAKAAGALFKAFEQHHENRSGLGLGLTIARRAIEFNHGTLEAHSISGKGCVFTITLPKEKKSQNKRAE